MFKALFVICLSIFICSCSQSLKLTISEDKTNPSLANASMKTQPIFTSYLQDLDLLSGLDIDDTSLPSLLSDFLTTISQNQSNFTQDISYAGHQFLVKYNFNFTNLSNFLGSKYSKKYLNKIISIDNPDGKTRLKIKYNMVIRSLFQEDFDFLLPIKAEATQDGQTNYLHSMSRLLAAKPDDQRKAVDELQASALFITLVLPRPVLSASEGDIKGNEWSAIFLLKDLLYPVVAKEIEIIY